MTDAKPVRADAARNRDAIIAAARAAFERGEIDRRFDDFATLAGVGVGTLYRHFPTRDALAEAVYRDEVDALCRHAAVLLTEQPPAQALATFLHDFVDHLAVASGLARTLATLMQQRSDAQAQGGLALENAVAELVSAGVDDGSLPPHVTAGVVVTALHGIGASYGRPEWKDDAQKLIAVLTGRVDSSE